MSAQVLDYHTLGCLRGFFLMLVSSYFSSVLLFSAYENQLLCTLTRTLVKPFFSVLKKDGGKTSKAEKFHSIENFFPCSLSHCYS